VFDLDKLRAMVGDDAEAIPELAGLFYRRGAAPQAEPPAAFAAGNVPSWPRPPTRPRPRSLRWPPPRRKQAGDVEHRARAGQEIAALAAPLAALEGSLDAVSRALTSHSHPAPPARPPRTSPAPSQITHTHAPTLCAFCSHVRAGWV